VPVSLDKSHPEVVAEIRRLARLEPRPTITEIKDAIKEKFNYPMLGNTVKKWAGVDFETRSGIPITQKQKDDIVRLKSVDDPITGRPPTDIEVAEKLKIGVASVRNYKPGGSKPYLTVEEWAEIYPDMKDNLLSNDKEVVSKARDAAHHRRTREILRAIRESAAQEVPFEPLTDAEMRKLSKSKAVDILSSQKERAKIYKIGPDNFIYASDYRNLEKKPKILGTHYQGNFSTDSVRAMKKMYADALYEFLKSGGNPNHIPFHFGHVLPMRAVDPPFRGFTNVDNVEIQDREFNRKQSNKITKELLKKYGYHTGFVNPRVAGLLAVGGATTLGFMSLLSPEGRKAAEAGVEKAKTVGERVLRKNPVIMETLNLLGVPQEKMFETIYNLQGQGEWKGDRRIDAGDIVQNAMGQEWMSRNPKMYATLATLGDIGIDPLMALGKVGGLLKSGVSGLRKLRNIWEY